MKVLGKCDEAGNCTCPFNLRVSREDDYADWDDPSLPGTVTRCFLFETPDFPKTSKKRVETYFKGKLDKNSCNLGEFSFHPEQMILKVPHSAAKDVNLFPGNDYKDTYISPWNVQGDVILITPKHHSNALLHP